MRTLTGIARGASGWTYRGHAVDQLLDSLARVLDALGWPGDEARPVPVRLVLLLYELYLGAGLLLQLLYHLATLADDHADRRFRNEYLGIFFVYCYCFFFFLINVAGTCFGTPWTDTLLSRMIVE